MAGSPLNFVSPSPNEAHAALLLLYEKTQDSAEHADALGWEATSIIWGSILLLLGFVLEALSSKDIATQAIIAGSGVLAIVLTWTGFWFAARNNIIMRHKYAMCRAIERTHGFQLPKFRQHCRTDRLFKKKRLLKKFRKIYILTSVLFTCIWVGIIIVNVWNILHLCRATQAGL